MTNECVAAAAALSTAGISAEVIDLRAIAPWDQDTVRASVARTGHCVVVHEAVVPFGVGAEISTVVTDRLFGSLKPRIARVGAPFTPLPSAQPLDTEFLVSPERIVEAAGQLLETSRAAQRESPCPSWRRRAGVDRPWKRTASVPKPRSLQISGGGNG